MSVFAITPELFGIELLEGGQPGRSSAYFIAGRQPILVETGSYRSLASLMQGLTELGVAPGDLRHIVVTHVHLDHAGGVGHLMAMAPHALVHCHPRAARHLIDPTRLVAGAKAVYGDALETMFGEPKPVPADRVVIHGDKSTLQTGDRTLIFYDTPGHAKHHLCVLDQVTQGLFSGDTVGIRYDPAYTGWPFVYGFPTTSPADFDPAVMLASLDRLQSLNPSRVYHTHFGVSSPAEEAFAFTRQGVWAIQAIMAKWQEIPDIETVQTQLRAVIQADLRRIGYPVDMAPLEPDILLNSLGMLAYGQKSVSPPR